MEPSSFHHYICNLNLHSLPRVVKVCSGVYFEGSVYELSGSECCLSTGDLMKIVDVQLQKVICENMKNGHVFVLPPHFKGYFQPSSESPCQRKPSTPTSLFHKGKVLDFQEKKLFTLWEVLQSSTMRHKRLKCDEISKDDFQLSPIYTVKAIMHFRKDVVTINSTLDIEVTDVTEETQDIHFIKPLMLSEVLAMDGVLPVEAEILGGPENPSVFQSKWISHLHRGQRLHIHNKASSWKILASTRKGKTQTYFLISSNYEGCFRRCPRKFSTPSELALSLATTKQMHVVVTKDHENIEGEFPLFSVGDRLEVLRLVRASNVSAADMLVCCRDNGDEEKEQIEIPLFLEAGFVEDIRDTRKYTLSEAVEYLHLPCEVKVIASDHNTNPLLGCVSFLTLEAQIAETFLTVSLTENPNLTFELHPQWLDISLFFTEGSAKPTPPTRPPTVEELPEALYYQLLKQLPSNVEAPPRPPKQKDSTCNCVQECNKGQKSAASSKYHSKPNNVSQQSAKLFFPESKQISTDHDTWNNSNQYTIRHQRFQEVTKNPSKKTTGTAFCDNSDHDYEEINEEINVTTHRMQNASI